MKTLVFKVDPDNPEIESIRVAADLIRRGGLVAFPTETVYGLGADAMNVAAILKLYRAKKRPLDNPPIVHVCELKDVYRLVREVPSNAEKLMGRFWPGPLTLIFRRSSAVPKAAVAGLDTIAVRMPMHKVALALIRESGCPISAPSANLAGKPSPTSANHVLEDLKGKIDAVLDGGPTAIGVESTVLDLTVSPPQILRPGGITFESLKEVVSTVQLNPVVTAEESLAIDKARSPGLKHKHYAPNAKVIVVEGDPLAVINKTNELSAFYAEKNNKVGVLCTDETARFYRAEIVKSLGSSNDLRMVARNLFSAFRDLDSKGVDIIIAEGVPLGGLGLAVMNRLRKASGYKIVKAN